MINAMNGYILNGNEELQKLMMQANIRFTELYKYATFTSMRDPIDDPYEFEDGAPQIEFYQWRTDPRRVKEIAKFIRTMEGTNFQIGETYNIETEPFYNDSLYIVDGQHRLMGMMSLYDSLNNSPALSKEEEYILNYLRRYVFNCTVLLNFDLWEQAQVFADVNFNQKKVDKSLYYTIYGMQYSTNPSDYNRNYIYIAHNLVKFMNTHPASPLKGTIMMVGNKTGYKKALMSQACLAEALITNIYSPRGIWYVNPNEFVQKPDYRYMAVELLSFYTCVMKTFPSSWPMNGQHRSILLKTTGIWVLNKLMAYIHKFMLPPDIIQQLKQSKQSESLSDYEGFVIPILEKLVQMERHFFAIGGIYSGSGGKGLAKQLFDDIIKVIDNREEPRKDSLISQEEMVINEQTVGVKIYKSSDDLYYFRLSHYFQNKDQMDPYISGSGSVGNSLDDVRNKLQLYKEQVQPDAKMIDNKQY